MKDDLYLRRVIHPQADDNYRVVLKDDGLEIEIGSIGIRYGSGTTEGWAWQSRDTAFAKKGWRPRHRRPRVLGAVLCYQRSWRRTDDIRLSDIEPNFVCKGARGL